MTDFLKIYLPITLLVVAGFVLAWQFASPAPPKRITIATGSPDGTYTATAEKYHKLLGRQGVTVSIRHTNGALENIGLLKDPKSGVDVAFVQGGIGDPFGAPELMSLGSVFYEPVWLFVRGSLNIARLAELRGSRIAVGVRGSGTRVLARLLLAENGVYGDNATFRDIGGEAAARALIAGEVDAAFFVAGTPTPTIRALAAEDTVRLMSFGRAPAYKRKLAYLAVLDLPEGALDLAANRPDRDIMLVAPTAALVARRGLHPALVDLLLTTASRVHADGNLVSPAGVFPSPRFVDFPLSEDARRYFKSGPTFLRRVLPFWAAIMAERLLIMLVPLVTLMIPLFKLAPPAYRWQVRRRIFRWYKELREIEEALHATTDAGERARLMDRLDTIQRQVGQLKVPLSYAEQLYHLRLHIGFIRLLAEREAARPAPSAGAEA